ncbi:ATP-dependent NAD(P)HX deHydratase [Hyphodiscus hymeniophilus]|uniref:ATP-dependent (S)-NAD(P)H-hydrate dehydratase n=1 Tax=Hyphodiscus hymeniophilus TaxID=353542 RepID=A0A9P7AWF5_9HELO|nr:ATP-dependent NAD(P)HX deHydratase [Hyphodiscus hymeniophilus]
MSQATKEILMKVKKMVPPMLEKFHKGQMGRVAVIGGSEDYTGAPYFSAMASARLGCDMSHVICEPQASQVIKTYSPNLMVHPLMRQSSHASTSDSASSIAKSVIDMLPRLHVLVIGPGLGRDSLMQDTVSRVIEAARKVDMPIVLDADGLNIAQTKPDLIHGYRECILTPNVVEFGRLCKAKGLDPTGLDNGQGAEKLAQAFGGSRSFRRVLRTTFRMESRRSLATFLAWRKAYLDKIWDHDGELDKHELLALAAFGGSSVTRECSRLAFSKKGRSLQASDLTDEVYVAFTNLFEGSSSKL